MGFLTRTAGGETIKNMQTDTGCKINVSPATGQDIERDIGLVGSRDSIERAKHAIMEKVHAVVSLYCNIQSPLCLRFNSRKRTTAPAVEEADAAQMTANSMALLIPTTKPRTSDRTEVSRACPLLMIKQTHMQPTVAMKLMQCFGIIINNKPNKTPKLKVPPAHDVIRFQIR